MGEYKKAIADYEVVIRKEPQNPDPYFNIANACVQLKDKEKALHYFDRAIALGCEDAVKAKIKGLEQLN